MSSNRDVPVELLSLIFSRLSLKDLASASLVCKLWQIAAFPHLYHTFYPSDRSHLEVLASRLTDETTPESLPVSVHLRALVFHSNKKHAGVRKEDLHHLDNIVPRLTQLKSISWELYWFPDDFHWFAPPYSQPESVYLSFTTWNTAKWEERLPQLLPFTNLTHFSFQAINDRSASADQPIASLLQTCPNLESLAVTIGSRDSVLHILSLLGSQVTFPKLQKLHLLGDMVPDWPTFTSSAAHILRTFLTRHTHIRDLAFGCSALTPPGGRMNPDDIAQTFPSVTQVICPDFLCESLVASKIASQLERLTVIDRCEFLSHPLVPIAKAIRGKLSNLRAFKIWTRTIEFRLPKINDLPTEALGDFLSAANDLETLFVEDGVDSYTRFLSVLGKAGKLRQIALNHSQVWRCALRDTGRVIEWDDVGTDLANACPQLERIIGIGQERLQAWKVVRDGQPSLVEVEFPFP